MAVGDIYRLKDFQTFLGQQVLNVYYYRMSAGSGGAQDLITAYLLDVLPNIVPFQTDDVTHTVIEAMNLASLTDFAQQSITSGGQGQEVSQSSSPFHAYGFRLVRTTRETRQGYKRYAGVPSPAVVDGVITTPSIQASLSALEPVLAATIDDGLGQEFEPIIARIGLADAVLATNDVQAGVYYGLTTQSTRKFGSGG